MVIRLPARVHLTALSVQHIYKEVSPSGTVLSAPRDIAVFVSLCWVLLAGMWPWGKAVTGTCLLCASLEVRVLLSPKPCSALAGYFRGSRGSIPLRTRSGESTLKKTQGGDSA